MPDDPQENLRKEQLKSALGMSASKQYGTIEGEKMAKELVDKEQKEKVVKNLRFDEKSIDRSKEEALKIAEKVARGFTPLSPIDQQKTVKTQSDEASAEADASQDIRYQDTASQPQLPSTRQNQKQINRVDSKGQKIQPRLAEPNRVQPQEKQPSVIKPGIGKVAKKAAAKALPIVAPIASGLGGAALAYLIA